MCTTAKTRLVGVRSTSVVDVWENEDKVRVVVTGTVG